MSNIEKIHVYFREGTIKFETRREKKNCTPEEKNQSARWNVEGIDPCLVSPIYIGFDVNEISEEAWSFYQHRRK